MLRSSVPYPSFLKTLLVCCVLQPLADQMQVGAWRICSEKKKGKIRIKMDASYFIRNVNVDK